MTLHVYPSARYKRDYLPISKGENNIDQLPVMPEMSAQKLKNMEYRNDTLGRRAPFIAKSTIDFNVAADFGDGSETPGQFYGAHEYIDADAVSRILHAHNNGTVKEFVSSSSSVNRVTGLNTGQKVRFVNMRGACFFVNGLDGLYRGDATTWRVGGAPTAPTSLALTTGTGSSMAAETYQFIVLAVIESGGTALLKSEWLGPSSITLASAGAVKVDWTASADSRVTHYYIYRSLGGVGQPFFYDGKVTAPTVTYNANTADADLSETQSDPAGQNYPPSTTSALIAIANQRMAVAEGNKFSLSIVATTDYEMECFPQDGRHNDIKAPGPGNITALKGLGVKDEDGNRRDLFVGQPTSCYVLRGTDPDTELEELAGNVGVKNPDAIVQWGGYLFFVSNRGLEFLGPQGKPLVVSKLWQHYFEGGGPLGLGGDSDSTKIYLEIFENKLLITLKDDTSFSWANRTLVMDLEAFQPYADDPSGSARITHWELAGGGFSFFVSTLDQNLIAFDNENSRMLVRNTGASQDVVDGSAVNIDALIWSWGVLSERLNERKTPRRFNAFYISDQDATMNITADFNRVGQDITLTQNIGYKEWIGGSGLAKNWIGGDGLSRQWIGGKRWIGGGAIDRKVTGYFFQFKVSVNNNGAAFIWFGFTITYTSTRNFITVRR